MKKKYIYAAAFAIGTLSATAQINSPQSAGYEARAAAMLADGNFIGCINQCETALELGSNRREQLTWLPAVAAFNGGLPEASNRINAYIAQFPHGQFMDSAKLMLATLTFYSGDYNKALKEFDAINISALNDNQSEDLTYRKAYSLMKLAEYKDARALMENLLTTPKYKNAATFYLAYIDFAEGDYDKALAEFAQCDKTTSPGDMADYYVGQILFKSKEYGETLNTLRPLLSRKNIPAEYMDECLRISGECYYALHDDNRAMVYLNDYIKAHREDAPLSTRYIVGVERYQIGDYQEALDYLAPVSQLTDEMGQSASLTMGQSYQAMGNYKSAIICFDKAVKMDFNPQLTEIAYYNYAVAQVDGGRVPFGNSVQTLEDFLHRYPNSRYAQSVREYLVKGYMATDDYEGALRSLNAMPETHSAEIDAARQRVNFVLGTRALQSGNSSLAVKYLTEAMKYGGSDADIESQTSLWLGDAYYAESKYAEAVTEYKSFLASSNSKDPNRNIALYNLGYAEFAEKDYVDARKRFQSIVADKNVNADMKQDSYNRIGDIYYYSKELAAAKNAYQSAYDLKPKTADYSLLQISMMKGHLGDFFGKIQSLNKFITDYPKSSLRPIAQTEIAITLNNQGKRDDAIKIYEDIARDYAATSYGRNALLQIAILSDNKGNTEGAKQYYKQIITTYPTSQEASLAVQDLKRIYGNEGKILELDDFLSSIKDAPQLDATERNAIAAASMLEATKKETAAELRVVLADKLLAEYPDAAEAEEALLISSTASADLGLAGKALEKYTRLEQSASTATMRHAAQLGIMRSADELGDAKRVLSLTQELLDNPATTGVDLPEVKFKRSIALSKTGSSNDAVTIWKELSSQPTNIYGTRASYELASYYYRSGNYDIANKTAEALIDANPPHAYWLARTFILYSDILRAQGSEFEADEYLKILRANYPGTENDIFQMIDKRLPQ
ncbi:MAG: tetratricopeptide repeat protein [Bacteroides sp.]|nr:tetratricopeptide repeat protein [Bacteroides sp.]MCM1379965.1 tetratricopeptide repeat protein [Bacteroides sp.]MCM1446280.1 tetratricopeptide repeat protein [Prevotella sp.]